MAAIFTSRQTEIITGSLLGDAGISPIRTPNANCYFHKKQCERHKEYLDWIFEELGDVSSSIKPRRSKLNGKIFPAFTYITHTDPYFRTLREEWYPEGKKIVPKTLKLTPLTIAVWFFDDGSNHLQGRNCSFYTNGFTRSDSEWLLDKLRDFGITGSVEESKGYIRTDSGSYKALVDLVKPFMLWDCFQHKVVYRDPEVEHASDDVAVDVLRLREEGLTQKKIASTVGVSVYVVHSILSGKTKRHVSGLNQDIPKSGVKGVYWNTCKKAWIAAVRRNNKLKYLGTFKTVEEAEALITSYHSKS